MHVALSTSGVRRRIFETAALGALAFGLFFALAPAAEAGTVPAGFQDAIVFSGLDNPTSVRFAADGRVFVAEKSGVIKVFDNLNDPTPTIFANLNVNTYNFWDRGLLGMALAPNFPADPWVYVMYTYDASIGGIAPRWGVPGVLSDGCPTPPGPTTDGCVVSGRLSRLQANGNQMTGSEQVLIEDWCQQYPSHSVGSLEFGADGALYLSGGEGASFNFMDYGQAGIPKNPCGDPPGAPGSTLSPPTAEGGALRSQDLRTPADPLTLDGAIARVDPATGLGKADNPLFLSSDPNARRIIAHGFRNPFRITVRPGTSEVWAGDVGWNTWEEVNRLGSSTDAVVDNFGWPCYEGPNREESYDAANLAICENLYSAGSSAVVAPWLTYNHGAKVVPGESCPVGSSSVSGLAFYTGGNYPDHNGALFFADYSRSCIWVMKVGTNGLPDPTKVSTFDAGAAGPVDIEIGPGGDLFYAGFDEGTIRRIRYFAGNQAPTAIALANPQSGPIPLTVNFDGRSSSDPEGGALTYSWDLNGDGTFGDSTAAQPSFTYTQTKTVTVRLRVTDGPGATAVGAVVVNAGNNTPPVPVINTPGPSLTWRVGDLVSFSGTATDAQDGTLPGSSLSWELVMNHCPSNCHSHPLQSFVNVANGSFNTPDHEYPSYLELRLTATDADGASATTSVRLNPQTVDLSFASNPAGLEIAVNGTSAPAPFTRTVIVGSLNTVSAVSPQSHGGNGYTFLNWSDGGAATHSLTAGVNPATYSAAYDVSIPGPVAAYGFEEPSGAAISDSSGKGNNGTFANAVRTTAGRFGSALTFNGTNAMVTIPDAPTLDLTNSMTLEAWVRPATLAGAWRTVLMKEQAGNLVYDLYAGRTGSPAAPLSEVFATGSPQAAQATTGLALNTWSHLASTYDGEVVRLYVNGTQVATQAAVGDMPNSTGALRIGGNNIWSEWFDGQIDEVRVYGRVLTQTEIQADMNKAVVNPDSGPPTAPSNLAAIGSLSSVALAWSGSSDDVGVVRYNVHRSTTQGFTPSAANRVGQPTATSFADSPLAAGTYYYRVTAEDAAGNISAASGEASAVVTGDTTPPSAPATLAATGSLSSVALTWGASSDNVGVVRYNVHRSTVNGFTPSAANRISQPAGTSFNDTGLAAGTYYYRVTAEDAAGNLSAASNQATATVTGDTSAPTAPANLTATPGSGTATLGWAASTDNVAVVRYNVHRSTVNGFTPSVANRIAQPTGTSYSDSGLAPGTYYYRVTAEDAAGNVSVASAQASAVVSAQPAGLVAAYGFDAGSGTAVADASGNNNNGTLANGTWSATGRYGGAIQFNGSNTWVSVPNATSLNPTAGVTMEAWVNPSVLSGWRTVVFKEQTGNLTYGMYGSTSASRPNAQVFVGGTDRNVNGTAAVALNTWTHLAATYDGANIRIFVNGTQAATVAQTGAITTSTGVLHIGGNNVWSEWFQGLIDEVRIYNRALSATEIQADMATSIGNQDTSPPTAPAGVTPTIGLNSVALAWTASTDNVGVVRYNVHRSTTAGFTPSAANRIAQPAGNSYSDSPLSPATYYYRVTAEDAAGNISAASAETSAVVTGDVAPPSQPSNVVANGSLSSAALTWTPSTDNVGVVRYNVHRGTTPGFTPAAGNRVGQPVGASFTDSPLSAGTYYYRVIAEDAAGNLSPASAETSAVVTGDVTPPTAPSNLSAIGAISSVALAWSGSTDNVAVLRYNVHRSTTQGFTPSAANRIAQQPGTGLTDSPLTAGTYYYRVTAEDAAGNISAASGEASAVVTGDITPPSQPANLVATGALSSVGLTWSASSDNVAVVRYNLHRSTTNGFTPSAANRIAQPTGTSFSDSPLSPATYYYVVTAEDAAGNVSVASAQATAVVTGDITAPTAPGSPVAVGSTNSVALSWTASTDNVGVLRYNVHRSTTNGFTPSAANRVAQPTGLSFTDSPLSPATYYYRVTAEDAAGNISAASAQASAVVSAQPTGLIAAYGFDEGSGTAVADSSGNNNSGTLANTTWTAAGKFGSALNFNGSNAWVSVPNATSLNPTAGVTMEAWVNPSSNTGWRTVMFKEQTGNLTYGLYGNTSASRPNAQVFVAGTDRNVNGTAAVAANTWTHLAATYDGVNLRLFVNGTQAATIAQTGAISTSTGVLRIGGNNVWSEWFQGLIDEVRIYNRALSATEIQADMATSVSTPDTSAPTAPTGLGATGSIGTVTLGWTAATDDVAVARYNVHRGTTAGFTPTAGNRVGQPTGTSYVDAGLTAGTYFYRVTAEDAAGNVSTTSNEASASATSDTTAPTVSMTAPAAGATVVGTTNVSANASDNVGVAGVQFKLDGANLGAEDTTAPFSFAWDTRTATNGSHQLAAVARDASGNQTTSAPILVTVDNTAAPVGLVAGYGFDEGIGSSAGDASGNGNGGTVAGTTWVPGRFGTALSFNGTSSWVTVPDSAGLDLTSAMTLEAWIYPTALGTDWRTVVFKEQPGNLAYGLYANTTAGRPNAQVFVAGSDRNVNGTTQLPANTWTHLAATYDGANIRLFVNGSQVAVTAQTGAISTSTGVLRIGGNNIWPEWFQGRIDEIRIYSRTLTATEILNDSAAAVANDTTPPSVTAVTPPNGTTNLPVATVATATFNEAMDPATISGSTFELRDGGGTLVPATVTYDALAAKATLTPTTALLYGTTYTATVKGGASGTRARDMSGNSLPANAVWSFTLEAGPPPVLLVTSSSDQFSSYTAEILKGEGLNEFTTVDASLISPALLNYFDVVVLGNVALSGSAVTAITGWVTAGGNLVAVRPDKQLAGLLGLTDAGGTLANAYLLVNTISGPGVGIVGATMQFHGTADRYVLNGATAVATLYSNATTSTINPAVTIRSVGASGGQAAAFTYDLTRSVVYTRQGNPAWAGQERDGIVPIRPNDLFYGAAAGDPQPNWLDVGKIQIPQADEQQRLLANLITSMARDRKPMPRFWYLPRGEKAAVVMTGDDHAQGGTAGRFDRYIQLSPAGCSVANWECIRSTSYVYANSPLTNAQAASYVANGFEVALHVNTAGGPCGNWTPAELETYYTAQLSLFQTKYTSVPAPVTERTHCVAWSDWATQAKVKLNHGMRLDTNYYHYGAWISSNPGFMTGSGLFMPFADLDGTRLGVYQAHTFMTDESGQAYPSTVNSLLDKAVGPEGYYGLFTANMHTDLVDSPGSEAIVSSALTRGVPVVSAKQALDWTEGRNASTFREFSWSGNTLTFRIVAGAGANGLEAMLPMDGPSGRLSSLQRGGTPVFFTTRIVKGVEYAAFTAVSGVHTAIYGG